MTNGFQRCLRELAGRGIPREFAYKYCGNLFPQDMTDEDRAAKLAFEEAEGAIETKKSPRLLHANIFKDQLTDELLPLLIILAHKRPSVKEFYKNLFDFCSKLTNRSSWPGQWMGFKLACMVMERFGLLWLGGAASYDAGLSWAFGVIAATEFLSDIQVGDIVQQIITTKKEG